MKKPRRKFSTSFKAKVAIEAIKEQTSLPELDAKFELHPTQISSWKREFLNNVSLGSFYPPLSTFPFISILLQWYAPYCGESASSKRSWTQEKKLIPFVALIREFRKKLEAEPLHSGKHFFAWVRRIPTSFVFYYLPIDLQPNPLIFLGINTTLKYPTSF